MWFLMWLGAVMVIGPLRCVDKSFAYSTGAPQTACISLTPVHKDNQPQKSSKPYSILATKTGNTIAVTISSPYGDDFEGFVMQARLARNKSHLVDGTFSTRQDISKAIDCGNGVKNTITQVSKTPKSEVTTEWSPRSRMNDDIIFRATVARTFQFYWTEIDSQLVSIGGSDQKQNQNHNSEDMYNDCFVNKGCFGYPPDCVTRRNCDIFLSYVDANNGVSFTMLGSLDNNNYMATGLSLDRGMGDDSVTECFLDNNRVMAQYSWNEPRDNTPQTLVPEGMYEWRIQDGIASCSWNRPYATQAEGTYFYLKNETYYILLAKGPMLDGRVSRHDNRLSSQDSVNFTAYEIISGASAHAAVKVHGTFMVTGWIAFASLAILIARHFKNMWESRMLFGVKVWFAVHRGFMIIALLFIMVAFIVIFVHRKGWNYGESNPHAVLGCISTTLGIFQPIMAAFRPSPDHPKRPVFNWLHWAVGNIAQILAIVTIFFAVSLEASGLEESFYWVMGVFVVVHYFFHFVFHFHTYAIEKKKNDEIKMQNLGSGSVRSGRNEQIRTLPEKVFKILMLGMYCIFLTVIMLALYSLIGSA